MDFTCTKENLLRGVSRVSPVAGRNTQLPILQHILLQCKSSELHITGTDLEIGVHTTIGGKGTGDWSCTIPAREALEYTQGLPSEHPIQLQKKGSRLHISTKGFQAQFPTADPEDFPLLPPMPEGQSLIIDAQDFRKALTQVIFAAAREDTRPEIHSVYIGARDSMLHIAATDSFRLAERILPTAFSGEFSTLLPLTTAQEIVRIFEDRGEITITPSENHILIAGGEGELSSRVVDGTYPDYQQIIPQSHTSEITIAIADMVRALKTLTVFLPKDSRRVQCIVEPKKEEMSARVIGSEKGQGEVVIPITGSGSDVELLVNIQYLLEGLQHLPGQEGKIYFSGPQDPVVIQPKEKDAQYVYIVMPIQQT